MNSTEKFNEMVAYDFSNLNVQQSGNDNCFCNCDCNCVGGDCDCDCNYCDNN